MNTLPLLIALFLKLNTLIGGLPDYPRDYASIEAWLGRVTPVYAEMGLVTTGAVMIAEVERPADVPEDVTAWVESEKGYYKPPIFFVPAFTEHPLSIRAGIAHDYLHLQTRYLGQIKSAAKQVQYEQVAEGGMLEAMAIMASRGDPEARAVLIHSLWERSIVSTLYQALWAGGVEEAEKLLASYNLDDATHTRFHRVIELYEREPKTSRTLDSMYYNGVLGPVLAEGNSELAAFIQRQTAKPRVMAVRGWNREEAGR